MQLGDTLVALDLDVSMMILQVVLSVEDEDKHQTPGLACASPQYL